MGYEGNMKWQFKTKNKLEKQNRNRIYYCKLSLKRFTSNMVQTFESRFSKPRVTKDKYAADFMLKIRKKDS
jgi:hypothetical protein